MATRNQEQAEVPMAPEHNCRPYRNARGERVDPAQQNGIGCTVCNPPDGRVSKKEDTNAG